MRVQLSVALVAMTDASSSPNPDVPVYDWNNTSIILSSFYWGYLWLQILAGNVGRVYGTKYFLLGAMTINATICCLIPVVTMKWESYGLMAIRALQGLSQGFFFPSVYDMLSKWCPSSERSRLGNLVFSGSYFGTIISMPLVAVISTTWYGWPLSFYIYSAMGYLWVIAFYFFGASDPASHESISQSEKEYIESNLDTEEPSTKIPWKKILTNLPFWALFCSQVGLFFSSLIIFLETPTYLNKVMKYDLKSNGFLSASPNLASFLLIIIFGYLADYIINHNILSVLWTRKVFNFLGSILPAAAILSLGFVPEDKRILSVLMLIIAAGTHNLTASGALINQIDLSPNYAGVLLGIVNGSGCLVSIFGPIAVQFIVKDQTDRGQWRIIFYITALMYIIPGIIYTIFASADVQDFDSSKDAQETRKERLKKHSVISVLSM